MGRAGASSRADHAMVENTPVLIVAGPTASGKSAVALALAERLGGAVINADSMQVYEGLRVLTARPSPSDEARAPHRLYGHVSRHARCSAGAYARGAGAVIAEVRAQGRVPVLVGGTGLYLRAVTEGLADVPPVPIEVEQAAAARWDADADAMRDMLIAVDPDAARLAPADRQRHVRRASVLAATGRTLSAWQQGRTPAAPGPYRAVVLSPPPDTLAARIDARAEAMMDEALREVAALRATGWPRGGLSGALGLAALAAHLDGSISRSEALERLRAETRRYAKRQRTWFRGQTDWPTVETAEEATLRLVGG